jgi:hypothetical protein
MSMGYSGYAIIDGLQILVTSLSIPNTAVRLDSASGWGMGLVGGTNGIDAPRTYDWSANDGSMSIEIGPEIGPVLEAWIRARSSSKNIQFSPGSGSFQSFDCWWTSIGFSANEGSAIASDVGFMAVYEGSKTFGSEYIDNREGIGTVCTMQPLNPSNSNLAPVPFWKSTVSGALMTNAEPITWNLNFTQDIQKIFQCGGTMEPAAPYILGFGPMRIELQLDLYIKSGMQYNVVDDTSAVVNLGNGTSFSLSQLELQSHTMDLKGQSDIATISLTYQTYGY